MMHLITGKVDQIFFRQLFKSSFSSNSNYYRNKNNICLKRRAGDNNSTAIGIKYSFYSLINFND